MEWEDLYDEYGYGNDPDGVLSVGDPWTSGGVEDADPADADGGDFPQKKEGIARG